MDLSPTLQTPRKRTAAKTAKKKSYKFKNKILSKGKRANLFADESNSAATKSRQSRIKDPKAIGIIKPAIRKKPPMKKNIRKIESQKKDLINHISLVNKTVLLGIEKVKKSHSKSDAEFISQIEGKSPKELNQLCYVLERRLAQIS